MDTTRLIKIEMAKAGVDTDTELAKRCNWSRANLHDRFTRNSWKVSDLERIADALGCDLVVEFVKRDADIIAKLDTVPNKNDYIRQLINADIERNK